MYKRAKGKELLTWALDLARAGCKSHPVCISHVYQPGSNQGSRTTVSIMGLVEEGTETRLGPYASVGRAGEGQGL